MQPPAVIEALRKRAGCSPTAPAVEAVNGERYSFRSLYAGVQSLAETFQKFHCASIGLLAENGPRWEIADLAAGVAGSTLVPLPEFFSNAQLRHVVQTAGLAHIYSTNDARIKALYPSAASVCTRREATLYRVPVQEVGFPGIAKITFTSGTTGTPKGVSLSWEAIENVARSLQVSVCLTSDDRHLCLLPLSTLLENVAGVYASILAGSVSIVLPCEQIGLYDYCRLDAKRLYEALLHWQPSTAIMPPEFLAQLLSYIERNRVTAPASLRFLAVGSSPVSPNLINRARQVGLPVYEGYGLSEAGSVVSLNTPAADRVGSVGKLLPHAQARINSDGELEVAGSVLSGYLGEAPNTAQFIKTGDLAHFDPEGFLYLDGRKKNVLVTSYGRNISPEWIERELLAVPEVRRAFVFGDGRPFLTAVIDAVSGSAAAIGEQINSINSKLPDYARIGAWICHDENGTGLTESGFNRKEVFERHRSQIERGYEVQPE